jgi:hypothetical protein
MATGLPPLQDITLPQGGPPHRALYRRRQSGVSHPIDEGPNPILGTGGVSSGLQAIMTPTLSTHGGGATIGHLGASMTGPRIMIPFPAALLTASAMASDKLIPTSVAGVADKGNTPSMMIDSEWFSIQAYPVEIRQYLATGFSFDDMPRSAAETMEKTQGLLRKAYLYLDQVGLNLKIGAGFQQMFGELVKCDATKVKPLHPYNENPTTSNMYMVLAYVLSTLLWTAGATKPLRDYPEVTYPGVIVASYVVRMTSYYKDLSKAVGGVFLYGGPTASLNPTPKLGSAINSIPSITFSLRGSIDYVTGRKPADTCSEAGYVSLQQAALNIKGINKKLVELKIPPRTDPLGEKIRDARCKYYLGLVKGTIKPDDLSAGIPGGDPGIEPLT